MYLPRGINDSCRVADWSHVAGPGRVVVVRGVAEDPVSDLRAGADRGSGFQLIAQQRRQRRLRTEIAAEREGISERVEIVPLEVGEIAGVDDRRRLGVRWSVRVEADCAA